MATTEIHPLFSYKKLNQVGIAKARRIAAAFTFLYTELRSVCPEQTREFSIVKTKLEEASFYAKKSVSLDPDNQESLTEPHLLVGREDAL